MDKFIANLGAIVGPANVLSELDQLLVYECDGLPQHKYLPRAVVFPSSTEQTAAVLRELTNAGVPFTPRGAGTGLSGGALALNRGVVIELARMREILTIDEANRIAVVQTGVVNSHVSRAVAHLGLHYVPDPSSQPTCTIGGNIAENAGGIHCLKYGTTADHVLGLRVALSNGEVVDLGGSGRESPGYDLLGVFVGSEGTFGVATEATLRLVPVPPTVRTLLAEFEQVDDASHAVSAIIAAGVMPAALEMMDGEIIRAVEASVFAAGLSQDIGAALLIELDGIEAGIDDEAESVKTLCLNYGARTCRSARDEAERVRLWAARKSAFGAVSRISPDSMIQDAVVPRSRLPEVLSDAYRISNKYQLRLANVFHAGDGNLHPLICFDSRFPEQVQRVKEAGRELMETCVRAGGSITGEHGVGFDKRELLSLIFSEADLETMLRIRDAFDPTGFCNPGKIVPMLRGCGEGRAIAGPQLDRAVVEFNTESKGQSSKSEVDVERETASSPVQFEPQQASLRLVSIVGDSNVSRYSPSALLVSPESIEQVCEVMKLASTERWGVAPAGAATWLNSGNRMERINLIFSTSKLTRLIEHEPADLVAITEAGITLRQLNEQLGQNGQWVPLDPPDNGRATIGGVVATGLGGAQQFGYGSPRRHVIGMKVVRADGSLIKVGGRVVKNVAGYDLCKLFTGSYGTLGIIVEVNFRLRPLPFATRTIKAAGERKALLKRAHAVIDSRLFPVAVELLSPRLARESDLHEGNEPVLLIRFAGSEGSVNAQAAAAVALLDVNKQNVAQTMMDDAHVWQVVAALPLRFGRSLSCRVGLLPADVAEFLEVMERHNGNDSFWQASLGDGRILLMNNSWSAESASSLMALRTEAEKVGASLIIEEAPEQLPAGIDSWGLTGKSARLMQRIKQQLDPDGILSPGTFDFDSPVV